MRGDGGYDSCEAFYHCKICAHNHTRAHQHQLFDRWRGWGGQKLLEQLGGERIAALLTKIGRD